MTELRCEMHSTWPWWTPSGWQAASAPAAYVMAETVEAGGEARCWEDALLFAQYDVVAAVGDELKPEGRISVYRHPKDGLFVEFENEKGLLTSFFVAATHATPFLVDRFPRLIQCLTNTAEIAADIKQLTHLTTAFIRHGFGEATVDENGCTKDDLREARAREAIWRRNAATAEAR